MRTVGWRSGRPLRVTLAPLRFRTRIFGDLETICIPAEFFFDGASVPRLPFTWYVAGGRGDGPACLHDWSYLFGWVWIETAEGLLKRRVTRREADELFHEALIVDPTSGARRVIAWQMWAAVRVGGPWSWRRRIERARALNPEWFSDPVWAVEAP